MYNSSEILTTCFAVMVVRGRLLPSAPSSKNNKNQNQKIKNQNFLELKSKVINLPPDK